jgi:hypothetical protein
LEVSVKKIPASISLALLFSGGVVIGGALGALTRPASNPPIKPAVANTIITHLTHHEAHVLRVFPGPKGLTGVEISGKEGPVIAWITDSGSAVIVGGVVDAKTNRNLTMQAISDYVLHPKKTVDAAAAAAPAATSQRPSGTLSDTALTGIRLQSGSTGGPVSSAKPAHVSSGGGEPLLRQFIKNAEGGDFAQVGQPGLSGPHVLYAFVDPNCIFCHKLFDYVQAHQAQLNKAGVSVVYLPVAILKQSSIVKAAEIVKGGWSALLENERHFNVNTEEGGLPTTLANGDLSRYVTTVHVNTLWMSRLTAANKAKNGTPFLVWRAGNGRAYYLSGFPSGKGVHAILDSMQNGWNPKTK